MKLSELETGKNKKVLAFGDSGTGKTVFACSFPTPIKVFDFDRKISSAASYYKTDPERLSQIDVTQIDPKSFPTFYTKLIELQKDCPYKTVIIDSVTTFAACLMNEVMKQNPGSGRSKVHKTTVPNLKDYQIAISHTKDMILQVLSLPCNIVLTAHISRDKDESTGRILNQPLIWGKELPTWLPMVFEEVYRTYVDRKDGKVRYLAQTQASSQFVARTQITGLPDPMELSYESMEKLL